MPNEQETPRLGIERKWLEEKNANEKKSLSVAATAVFGFCCLTQKQILSRERHKKVKEKVKNGDFFRQFFHFVTEPRYGAD